VGVSSSAPACSCCGFLCFFFSSRRRHTRFSRDWSSDVCSSDLAARAVISNHMGPQYGSHWYLEPKFFQRGYRHQALLDSIRSKQDKAFQDHLRECQRIDASQGSDARKEQLKSMRAKESYARHYALTYNTPDLMPAWAAMEEITLGDLSHLFKGLARDADKKAI